MRRDIRLTKSILQAKFEGLVICVSLGFLALLGGCTTANDQPATNNTRTANTATTNTATTNTSTTTTTTTTTTNGNTTTTASGNRVGVTECDDYLDHYEACLQRNVPESARAALRASLDTQRNAWRSTAATPQGRASLAQACTQAKEMARQQMTAYNCSW